MEWRLIKAGLAKIEIAPHQGKGWETTMHLESAGIVSKLYRVNDSYRALTDEKFCGTNVTLDALEGKRHRASKIDFDRVHHKTRYEERDLLKNAVIETKELAVPPCTHEIIGALSALRFQRIEPGNTTKISVTDGKKAVLARIDAQERETIKIDSKSYKTIRYEAFLFDNVLYRRKGRLLIWLTDDARHLPVQIQARLSFPIGTITIMLEKEEIL